MSYTSTITIYYDVVSPYSFLGFAALNRYKSIWNVKLNLQPTFLGGIMGATGNVPPATNPVKAQYMLQDLKLASELFNVKKFQTPDEFPSNSLPAMRILTVLKKDHQELLVPSSFALWEMYWNKNGKFSEDKIKECLLPVLGDLYDDVLMRSKSEENKQELIQTTKNAVKAGAFGAPWIVAEKITPEGKKLTHSFFGSDRLEALAFFLDQHWLGPSATKRHAARL
jgi:glutathione S-transferase kappa 1